MLSGPDIMSVSHVLLSFLFPCVLHGKFVEIRNDALRYTTNGMIVNAHDGGVFHFEEYPGLFFMYGTVYANCSQGQPQCISTCGYYGNTFALYTSPDLSQSSWTLVTTNVLPEIAEDNEVYNYWMPNVFFNSRTRMYVMQYWDSHCGFHEPCTPIATATTPYGPFKVAPPLAIHGGIPSSQMGMFVDDDGRAFVKYNTKPPGQHHVVEQLSDDWLSSTRNWSIVFWKPTLPWMEGGGMFKRGALYYYMAGSDCCFCQWGGDARVWTARKPLGPWHPGIAPALPDRMCNVTGQWYTVGDSGEKGLELMQSDFQGKGFTLVQSDASSFTFHGADHAMEEGHLEADGYVFFGPSAGDHRGVITSADGLEPGCDRIRWYGYESFVWCRQGVKCLRPQAIDAIEVNMCADGREPAEGVRVNPCAPGNASGTNFTVPAQQFNVIEVPLANSIGASREKAILFFGERSQSAADGFKSHNLQAWVPLRFSGSGAILPMEFPRRFELDVLAASSSASQVEQLVFY